MDDYLGTIMLKFLRYRLHDLLSKAFVIRFLHLLLQRIVSVRNTNFAITHYGMSIKPSFHHPSSRPEFMARELG